MPDNSVNPRPLIQCSTAVDEVESDIREGYLVYLAEVAEGEWPEVTLSTATSFDEYRRDYWREALPDLLAGTY